MNSQADRLLCQDLRHFLFQRLAELQQVRARLHPDRESDGGLAVKANQRRRRIGVAAGNGGHICQREEPVVDPEIDRLRLSSDANWPLTRTLMRSGPSWNTPEGATAFCACSEETMERVSSPRAAIFRVENSRKIFSSCAPRMSSLPTFGTVRTFARMSSTRSRNWRWVRPSLVKA